MIKKKRRIGKIAAIISVIAAIAIFGGGIFASGVLNGKRNETVNNARTEIIVDEEKRDKSNLLLSVYEDGKADLIMLISFDKTTKNINGTSISADTVLENDKDKRTITDLLSSDNADQSVIDAIRNEYSVPIHYYVSTDKATLMTMGNGISEIVFGAEYKEMQKKIWESFNVLHAADFFAPEIEAKIKQALTKENIEETVKLYYTVSDNITTSNNFVDLFKVVQGFKGIDIWEKINISLISGDYEDFENGILRIDHETGRYYMLQQMK